MTKGCPPAQDSGDGLPRASAKCQCVTHVQATSATESLFAAPDRPLDGRPRDRRELRVTLGLIATSEPGRSCEAHHRLASAPPPACDGAVRTWARSPPEAAARRLAKTDG